MQKRTLKLITGLSVLLGTGVVAWSGLADSNTPIRIPLHTKALSLDPLGVQDSHSLWVSRQLHCQLVRMKGREVVPEAAKEARLSSPTMLQITLNDSAKFHDGSPVTPNDVIATFNYNKANRKSRTGIYGWVKEVRATGPKSVTIELTQPVPQFLRFLGTPNNAIFPAKFLEKAKNNPDAWKAPDGCGGYKVENWMAEGKGLRLTPVAGGRPIEFLMKGDQEISKAEASQFDIIDIPFSEKLAGIPGFRDGGVYDPKQIFFGLNTQKKEWQSRDARCSLFSRLNTQPILEAYQGIGAEKATSFFPRGVLGYRPGHHFPWEGARAQATPSAAPKAAKGDFCLAFLGLSVPVELRGAYAKALEPTFGKVRTEVLSDPKGFGQAFLKTGCDALVIGLKSNYLDGYEFLVTFTEPSANFSGYKDPSLTSKVVASQDLNDAGQRALLYQEVESKIENECLAYPILTIPRRRVLVKDRLVTPGLGEVPVNEYYLGGVR